MAHGKTQKSNARKTCRGRDGPKKPHFRQYIVVTRGGEGTARDEPAKGDTKLNKREKDDKITKE